MIEYQEVEKKKKWNPKNIKKFKGVLSAQQMAIHWIKLESLTISQK